jgi:outer membrane lipoprotein carrier protein
LCVAALLGGGGGGAGAQDAATALARAERAYRETRTLRASFEQIIANPMLGRPVRSGGLLFLAPPDRFAMRFTEPTGDRIVADGTWLWAFTPSSVPDQVLRQAIPTAGPASPNLMGQFVDRPTERYTAEFVGSETIGDVTVDVVRLVPIVEGIPFSMAEIAVARTDGVLRRIVVTELSGQRRTLTLDAIERNGVLPESEFRFEVPAGVRVVPLP